MTTSARSATRMFGPLTESEGSRLISRLRHSTFLINRGVVLTTEPSNNTIDLNDGRKLPAVDVKIDAPTDVAAAMAFGFIVAVSEGIQKLVGAP